MHTIAVQSLTVILTHHSLPYMMDMEVRFLVFSVEVCAGNQNKLVQYIILTPWFDILLCNLGKTFLISLMNLRLLF